ncbi:MAG TPA: hypothetical protein VKQ36_09080 [Ktedonobacterales bacterium]|nr:hypothetical protein [Ktedonobacterales bacterium]
MYLSLRRMMWRWPKRGLPIVGRLLVLTVLLGVLGGCASASTAPSPTATVQPGVLPRFVDWRAA